MAVHPMAGTLHFSVKKMTLFHSVLSDRVPAAGWCACKEPQLILFVGMRREYRKMKERFSRQPELEEVTNTN